MPNDYQYHGFVKYYPHLQRKDLSYEERMNLYYENGGNNMCVCGRSPREDGKCVGFHKLNEQEWEQKKELLLQTYETLRANSESTTKTNSLETTL